MSLVNKPEEKKNECRQYPRTLFQKKWGVYTWNALDVFVMNKKGEAVFPFSRRPVPVNLFTYLRILMTPRTPRTFRPISDDDNNVNDDIIGPHVKVVVDTIEHDVVQDEIDGNNGANERQNDSCEAQCCSTPNYSEEKEGDDPDNEIYDDESISTWSSTDYDDYQPSEFDYDPYDSYDWEC